MNKKTMGFIITALLVGTMIVVMVKSNMEPVAPVETLQSVENEVEEIEETGLEIGQFPPDFELATLSDDTYKIVGFQREESDAQFLGLLVWSM